MMGIIKSGLLMQSFQHSLFVSHSIHIIQQDTIKMKKELFSKCMKRSAMNYILTSEIPSLSTLIWGIYLTIGYSLISINLFTTTRLIIDVIGLWTGDLLSNIATSTIF